ERRASAPAAAVVACVGRARGRRSGNGGGPAAQVWAPAAEAESHRLAGIAIDDVAAHRKMTKLWGDEAGRATKTDRILVLGSGEAGRRRAINGDGMPIDWIQSVRGLSAIRWKRPSRTAL